MARSKKDGKRRGGHKPSKGGTWLMADGQCGVDGKPTGIREPLKRKPKRELKKRTSKSRRRKSKEVLTDYGIYEG